MRGGAFPFSLIFHLPPNYKHFVRVYNESGITDRFAVLPHGERVDVSFAIRYNNGESSHESSGDQRSRGPAVHRHLSQYTNQAAYLFLVVTLIPLFSLGGLSYVQSAKVINSQFGKYGDNAVAQLEQQTSSALERMKQTAETIYSYLLDPSHSGIGAGTPSTYGDIMEKNDFESLLKSLRTQLTAGIYIITSSGYYYGENNLDVNKLGNIPLWNTRPKAYAGTYWLGFYKQDHSIKSSDNDNVPVLDWRCRSITPTKLRTAASF